MKFEILAWISALQIQSLTVKSPELGTHSLTAVPSSSHFIYVLILCVKWNQSLPYLLSPLAHNLNTQIVQIEVEEVGVVTKSYRVPVIKHMGSDLPKKNNDLIIPLPIATDL